MHSNRLHVPAAIILSVTLIAGCSFFPGAGTDSARICSDLLAADIHEYESLGQMAWFSHLIVVGTVSEPQGSRWALDRPADIVTDYTVDVDRWIRGTPGKDNQVRIRIYGGEIDGCVQRYAGWPPFEPGDRGVFFLRDVEGSAPPRYDLFGWGQGFWHVDADATVTNTAPHLRPASYPIPLEQFVGLIRTELENDPPAPSYLVDEYLVPLDESPVP